MTERDWEKVWRGSMAVAFPVAFVSAIMDRTLILTVMDLWENLTLWRWLFFLSSAFLLIGLARNSARLRKLAELQAGVPDTTLQNPALRAVRTPNRDGFVLDQRPDAPK